MDAKYENVTNLTLDMYMQGIKESYLQRNKIGRAISYAYAIIMMVIACAFFLSGEVALGGFFLVCGVIIFFWNLRGYRLGTKGSFLEFARLHGSHYQVEMTYRFYEDRLEQETDKTELTVPYDRIKVVYETTKCMIFFFDRKVIIMDKLSFIDCEYENVIEFIQEKNVKVHTIR